MPSFSYVARETGTGREIRSSLEAQTEQAAIAALLNRNLLVVSFQAHKPRQRGVVPPRQAADVRSERRPALPLGKAGQNISAIAICGPESYNLIAP